MFQGLEHKSQALIRKLILGGKTFFLRDRKKCSSGQKEKFDLIAIICAGNLCD